MACLPCFVAVLCPLCSGVECPSVMQTIIAIVQQPATIQSNTTHPIVTPHATQHGDTTRTLTPFPFLLPVLVLQYERKKETQTTNNNDDEKGNIFFRFSFHESLTYPLEPHWTCDRGGRPLLLTFCAFFPSFPSTSLFGCSRSGPSLSTQRHHCRPFNSTSSQYIYYSHPAETINFSFLFLELCFSSVAKKKKTSSTAAHLNRT